MRFARPRIDSSGSPLGPLLDVVLLLLIFFVVTSSFSNQSLELSLPSAESGRPQQQQGLVVAIDASGGISVDAEPTALGALRSVLVEAKAAERPIELRADRATAHEHVVAVLDLAQASGVEDLSIAVAGGTSGGAAPDAAGAPGSQ
jgi:biopolymer transport protein ExbD